MAKALQQIVAQLPTQKRPPLERWDPPLTGDLDMRIAADGRWFYLGTPIERPAMVKLFAGILRQEADQCYYLVTPVEKYRIQVDATPFVAVAMDVHGQGREQILTFHSNIDEAVVASSSQPLRMAALLDGQPPLPLITMRPGLEALLARPVYYELAGLGVHEDAGAAGQFGVWSAGSFFPLAASASLQEIGS